MDALIRKPAEDKAQIFKEADARRAIPVRIIRHSPVASFDIALNALEKQPCPC